MDKSDSITKLAAALSKAQAEMPGVKFDAENPYYKSRYASLGAVISTAQPILGKHGLAVVQAPASREGLIGVETILIHESGEYIRSEVYIHGEASKNAAQEAGKTITYLRRYALASVLGMYADEDTDAESPTGNGNKPTRKAITKPEERPYKPDKLRALLHKAADKHTGQPVNGQRKEVISALVDRFQDQAMALQFVIHMTGETSSKNISDGMMIALWNWLQPKYNEQAGSFKIDAMAAKELDSWMVEFTKEIQPA